MVLAGNCIPVQIGVYCITLHLSDWHMGFGGGVFGLENIVAFLLIIGFVFLLVKPYKESNMLDIHI